MAPPIGVRTAQRRAELNRIFNEGATDALFLGVESFGRALYLAATEATEGTARGPLALAEVFRRGINPSARQTMFEYLGGRFQQAVIGSFSATRKGPSGYRQVARRPKNVRFAGGRLLRALQSATFFEARPDGLRLVNTTELDTAARQWARLAFGALPAGRGSQRTFAVRWSNLTVAALGLEEGPRPAFGIPRGYWWNGEVVRAGGSGDEFYPFGEGPRPQLRSRSGGVRATPRGRLKPTRGIAARNFFDAGYARIAEDLPPAYEALLRDLYRQGSVQRVEHLTGTVPPPRRSFTSSVTPARSY